MSEGITKACSRCKKEIQCNMDSIKDCACAQIKLSSDCIDFLKKTKYDCLCNSCLLEIETLLKQADSAPTKPTEGIHYYLENGFLVFTELNHIQRGYCCQSNCRHCAYGYRIN